MCIRDSPKDRPAGFPHIIECEGFSEASRNHHEIRAADGIATLLHKIDPKAPDALLSKTEDSFVYHQKEAKMSHYMHILISRKTDVVTVDFSTKSHLALQYSDLTLSS